MIVVTPAGAVEVELTTSGPGIGWTHGMLQGGRTGSSGRYLFSRGAASVFLSWYWRSSFRGAAPAVASS